MKSIRQNASGFRLLVAQDHQQWARDEGLVDLKGFEEAIARARPVAGGRGPNWIFERPDSLEQIRLRPCRRGGVMAGWIGDRSLSSARVFREFSTWTTLRDQGISLPPPVLAVSRRRGLFWRSAFASIERREAKDGLDFLATSPTEARLRATCAGFARALREFHDAGAIHGDLHVRNILIDSAGIDDEREAPRCTLIDLDRTRIVGSISPRQRVRELLRFRRSLEKAGHGRFTTKRYQALVLSAYCAGDRALRRSLLRWSRLEALGIHRHRIAWRLGRLSPLG